MLLSKKIDALRGLSYDELLPFRTPRVENLETLSGDRYQLEVEAFWDDKPKRTLRVTVSIDDGGWRSFFPLSDDFIIAPDGTFVGE